VPTNSENYLDLPAGSPCSRGSAAPDYIGFLSMVRS